MGLIIGLLVLLVIGLGVGKFMFKAAKRVVKFGFVLAVIGFGIFMYYQLGFGSSEGFQALLQMM